MGEDIKDIRWIQRLNNFIKALSQLERAINLANKRALSELEEQGLIQAFEFTHELAWNTLKDLLYERGNKEIYCSKDASRAAFKYGIIQNGEIWMDMIQSRNKSSHTYNEETADEIRDVILDIYYNEFVTLKKKLLEIKEKNE